MMRLRPTPGAGLFLVAAALLAGAALLLPLVARAASVTMRVESVEAASGDEASVPITVDGASGIGAVQFVLVYDGSLLEAVDVEQGDLLENALLEFNADVPGRLAIAIASLDDIEGDGTIAIAHFAVGGEEGETIGVAFEDAQAWLSEDRLDVLVLTEDGALSIVGGGSAFNVLFVVLAAVVAAAALLAGLVWRRRGRGEAAPAR